MSILDLISFPFSFAFREEHCTCSGNYDPATMCATCLDGYKGAFCAECPGGRANACSGHGSCLVSTDTFGSACNCTVGYKGTSCSEVVTTGNDGLPSGGVWVGEGGIRGMWWAVLVGGWLAVMMMTQS